MQELMSILSLEESPIALENMLAPASYEQLYITVISVQNANHRIRTHFFVKQSYQASELETTLLFKGMSTI